MFYEIVYEDGTVSVADYPSDAVAQTAIMEQHNRAKTGKKNGPQEGPATRIAKVWSYETHPGSLYEAGGMTADEVKSRVADLLKGHDVVDPTRFAVELAGVTHPMINNAEPHDSKFKMDGKELKLELA